MSKNTEASFVTIKEVSRAAGLNPLLCPNKDCHKKVGTTKCVEELFRQIVAHVQRGLEVRIPNFGVFRLREIKGKTIHTPLMASGTVEFGDRLVLSFHQTHGAKSALNPGMAAHKHSKRKGKQSTKAAGKAPAKKGA